MSAVISVTLACGCRLTLGSAEAAPYCETHEEYRVQAVRVPPPRITAIDCAATGPYVVKGPA